MTARALLTVLLAASPGWAQFRLLTIDGISELPVPEVQELGTTDRDQAIAARYRIRNAGAAPAPLRVLEVAGAGFSLASPVALPQTVAAGAAVEFTVLFRASGEGSYSAALRSEGVSALLTARVVAQLTLAVETPAGPSPLANGATIQFATVERGASSTVRLLVRNLTGREQTAPDIRASGGDFGLSVSAAGRLLQPLEEARVELSFTPTGAGARRGTLTFGSRSFTLSGVGIEPPLPRPRISLAVPDALGSGQQGTASVLLGEKSRTGGRGVLTMTLKPQLAGAVDPVAVLSSGSRTAEFTVAAGDDRGYFADQPSIGFQTGTTAGTVTFSVRLGEYTDERSLPIPAASPTLSTVEAVRTGAGIEVRIAGFDNTRTAGPLQFTFFDRTGAAIAPGAIRTDGSGAFGRFFQVSEAGGLFRLVAAFPVTGDVSGVDAVEVELENASGRTRAARARF